MKRRISSQLIYMLGSAVCIMGTASPVSANPQGATVVHGNAQISSPNANTLQVDSTGNSIINWQSFSIGQSETTRFNQASSSNAVLNRVTGPDASNLLGNLTSNGHVFLINSNGIVIGEHARIDTAGFVASTLDIGNQDFLNGHLAFSGENAGAIINRGFVTAGAGGEIVFVAPQIENHGVLSVEDGRILLAAGEKVTIASLELDGIEFEVQAPDNSVLNVGELIASKGSVGIFAGSIKHEGVIAADSIGIDATGNIVLHAQSDIEVADNATVNADGNAGGSITIQSKTGDTVVRGMVEATGIEEQGGEIKILGNRVGLFGGAYIDASGKTGGGEILVGGDYQGKGETQTAQQTQISSDAEIHADALERGDGGKVIVWADGFTEAHGLVSATGGTESGDGGFVEISGKENLVFNGLADISAENGAAGTALFDPQNIIIGLAGDIYDGIVNNEFIENPTTNITFSSASVSTQLGLGNLVLQANNDITVDVGITGANGFDVTFQAGRSILFNTSANQGIVTNGGDITLIANSTLADGVNPTGRLDGAAIISVGDIGQADLLDSGGGDILLEIRDGAGIANGVAGTINIGGFGNVISDGGDITFRSNNGIDETRLVGTAVINAGTGSMIIESYSNGSTIDLGARGTGNQVVEANILNRITSSELIIGNNTTGDITVFATTNFNPSVPTTIQTGGNIAFNQGAGNDGISSDTGSITLQAGGRIADFSDNSANGNDIAVGSGGDVTLIAANGVDVETNAEFISYTNSGNGDVNILASGGATSIIAGANTGTGRTNIEETAGDMIITGAINQGSGNLNFNASSDLVNTGSITSAGQIELQAGGQFNNDGLISNNTTAADIIISADTVQLAGGGSIDAGADGNAETILRPLSSTPWRFGAAEVLTGAELNTILNNIKIGDSSGTIANFAITEATTLANNQNLTIETPGGISFEQTAGIGISGANRLTLIGGSVRSTVGVGTDVSANVLDVQTQQGAGSAGDPLTTQVSQLVATNSGALGSILIDNSVTNLTIVPTGIRNLATGNTDDIAISNTGGNINVNGLIQADGGSIAVATTTANDITVTTDIFANGTGTILLDSGRDLVIDATNSVNGGGVNVRSASGNISLGATNNIRVLGGNAASEWAEVDAGNELNVFAGNNLLLQGGSAQDARAALSGSNGGSVFANGDINILGGGGQNAEAVINASTILSVAAGGTLSLTGGSGNDANALISTDDEALPLNVVIDAGGDVTLTGGTGQNAVAAIGTDSAPISIIMGSDGPIGGNLNLIAGSGGGTAGGGYGAMAVIGAVETGEATDININVAGSINLQSNVSSGDNAFIGSQTGGGDINIIAGSSTAGGNINIDGNIVTAGTLSMTATPGTVNNGDIRFNDGSIVVNALNLISANLFSMQGGLLQLSGTSTFNDPVLINGGEFVLSTGGAAAFTDGYTQTAGLTTLLEGSILDVAGQYDLLGGTLSGKGTVVTPTLNNVGGVIAPGSNRPVSLATEPEFGTLTIDGDLVMGVDASLRFDLGGADLPGETGSSAGINYDALAVTGNFAAGGSITMVVDLPRYRGVSGDQYRLLTFGSVSGDPGGMNFQSVPVGYRFAPQANAGSLGALVIATPFDSVTRFISADEIEALNRMRQEYFDELVFLEQERRRRLQQAKDREEQNDKERRATASCT